MPSSDVPDVYVELAKRFLDGELTADSFSLAIVKVYKREESFFGETETQALNQLFYAAEDYCGDVEIRNDGDLDERQLTDAAEDFLAFIDGRRPGA